MSYTSSTPKQTLYCSSQGYFQSSDNTKYAYWVYRNYGRLKYLMIDLTNSELVFQERETLIDLKDLFVTTDSITLIANTGHCFRLEKTFVENALFLQHFITPTHPLRIKIAQHIFRGIFKTLP